MSIIVLVMITVLRLGHRLGRDLRISTHCGLVARAFGADEIIYSGDKDEKMMKSVKRVVSEWGGPFSVTYEKNWKKIIQSFNGTRIHLTMYGIPIQDRIKEIRRKKNILVIIGSEKVPGEVYQMADYNIAITNQPHSEVAALGVFLHEYFKGSELEKKFKDAKLKIIPQEKGKMIING